MAIDSAFLDQIRELNYVIKKRVSSLYSGGRASLVQGKGIEAVDHTEYFPGDDFRLIDWQLYARTEKLYIRRFEEEKDLVLHIVVDASGSMDFTTQNMTKYDYAGSLGIGFAYLAQTNNEKFGLALYRDQLGTTLQPKRDKSHLFKAIDLVNREELKGETNLDVSMTQYSKMTKGKSFFVLLSDFYEPIESLKNGLYRAAKMSKEMTLIQVLDPGEIDLGWTEDVEFEDSELHTFRKSYLSPMFKKKYASRVEEHQQQLKEICTDLGIDFFTVTTDTPVFESFVDLIGGWRHG